MITRHVPTTGPTDVGAKLQRKFIEAPGSSENLGSTTIRIRRGLDVTGDSRAAVDDWRDIVFNSEIVVFMFDVSKILSSADGHRALMQRECDLVGGFISERVASGRSAPLVALVGTHCDKVGRYRPMHVDHEAYNDFFYEVREVISRPRGALGKALDIEPKVVIGQMTDRETASDLSFRIFKHALKL